MKSILLLSTLTAVLLFSIIACRKNLIIEELNPAQNLSFNAAAAKEWYYGTFKKSAEWKSSSLHSKKLPNWKNGIYYKVADMEIVEFPLVKSKTGISIPRETLTDAELKKVAAASLTRIAFIKRGNKVSVREIDYIPEWQYLQRKNFDISYVMFGKPNNDFSGRMIVKTWGESILSLKIFANGKAIKTGSIKKARNKEKTNSRLEVTSSSQNCTTYQYCVWQMDCDLTIYGDGMVTNECGSWYNTGDCWTEEYCNEDCDPASVNCGCEFYGTCDPPPDQCDATAVYPEVQEFNNYVEIESAVTVEIDGQISSDGPNPISGSFNWDVIKAQFGSWQIRANTDFSYYHDRYFNGNTMAYQDDFNLFSFHTGNGYFVGSNTFITSTYTTTTPTTNQVINNNTPNTMGTSHVRGTINHRANVEVRIPFCRPLTLDHTDNVDNMMNFRPK